MLEHILTTYIHPQSIVHTDMWKGYAQLGNLEEDYTHKTVNHSEEFKP